VGHGSTLNLGGAAVTAIATTATTVLVTNEFKPAVAGAFFTATSAFAIVAALAALGTNVGLTYFIARLRSLGEERKIPAIMRVSIVPVIVASLILGGIMFAMADPVAHLLLRGRAGATGVKVPDVAFALRALAITIPFTALMNAFLGASRGYSDMRPSVLVGQVGLTLGRLVGVAAAAVAGGAVLLAPLWALPNLPAAIISWLWGRRISHRRTQRQVSLPDVPPEVAALLALSTPVPPVAGAVRPPPGSRAQPGDRRAGGSRHRITSSVNGRTFWAFTTPRAIANTAQNILQQIDIVLVAIIRGPIEAAIYTAATRFLVLGQMPSVAINRASQTRFTELFTIGDRRGANTVYRITTVWLVVMLWPLYLLAIVFGPTALEIFGHSYRAGDAVVVILSFAALLSVMCGQVDMVLITSGRSSWSLMNGLLTVGVNVGVDLVLIPKYGIMGAAIGWAIAIVVGNVVPLIQLGLVLRLHPFGAATILSCVVSGVAFGVIPLVTRLVLGGGTIGLGAAALVGLVLYAIGLWWFRDVLQLSTMPGLQRLMRRLDRGAVRR
jgi:O-antigen/teichoic acid export membrane protein